MPTWLQEWSTWFTSCLLVLVTLTATISPKLPSWTVRIYFAAELVATVVLETARHLPIAFDTDGYRILYCIMLTPVRLLACTIAWRESRWMALAGIPLGMGLLRFAVHGITTTLDQWILITDGVIVTSAGLGLAFSAAFSPYRHVYATLTILWMLLGLFDFGYALQPYGRWRELNDSLLPVMVIGAFGWITFKAGGRRIASQPSRS